MIHHRHVGWTTGILLVILASVALWLYTQSPIALHTPPEADVTPVVTAPKILNKVTYLCDAGHHIEATFLERHDVAVATSTDAPPVMTGALSVQFDEAAPVVLNQTISASGVRYATADESLVVWNKGQRLLVLDHDKETTVTGCLAVVSDPGTLPNTYASSSQGVTLRYPEGYTEVPAYEYTLSGTTTIPGVKFTVATATASGTNLSSDSYISIESIALPTASCTASYFLGAMTDATSTRRTLNDILYSYASTSGAGAGNRYEEEVFVRPGTESCVAVRYVIHTTVIENYDPGTVLPYDKTALLDTFDSIRDTVTIQ